MYSVLLSSLFKFIVNIRNFISNEKFRKQQNTLFRTVQSEHNKKKFDEKSKHLNFQTNKILIMCKEWNNN